MESLSKAAATGIALAIIIFFSACMPSTELRDRAIVQGVGLDISGEDYTVTLQIFSPADSQQAGKVGYYIVSGEGGSLAQALDRAQSESGKSLFFGDLELLLISESALPNLYDVLDSFNTNPYVLPTLPVAVVRGSARGMLPHGLELDPTGQIDDRLIEATKQGRLPPATLMDILSAMNTPTRGSVLPLIENTALFSKDFDLEFVGGVMLSDKEVVGHLSPEQIEVVGWLASASVDFVLPYKSDNEDKSLQVSDIDTELSTKFSQDAPHFILRGEIDGHEVSAAGGVVMKSSSPQSTVDVQGVMLNRIEDTLDTCYGAGCDVLRMGERFERDNPSGWNALGGSAGWQEILPRAQWQVEVKLHIRQ